MATLDLTLSKMRFPGIENFNPEFGTKETTGRGVHSVNLSENDMMPFLWQRPLSVVENSTTGNIEGDRKLAIEAASVTLTLGRPAYAGCKIDVYGSFQSGTSTVSYDKDASNTATITVGAGEHIELVANASRYFEPKAPALAEVVAASGTLSQAKTIPLGYTAESRLAFKVVFPAGHNDGTSSDGLTLNGIPVVSNQNGTLTPIPHHAMDDGNGGTVYKVLDANTVLELYYTADYDGNQNPAFVVVGNPLVLSSNTYSIYANGYSPELYNQITESLYYANYSRTGWTMIDLSQNFTLAHNARVQFGADGNDRNIIITYLNGNTRTLQIPASGSPTITIDLLKGEQFKYSTNGPTSYVVIDYYGNQDN